MKRIPFFETMLRSIFDFSVYRDVAVLRPRHGLLYYFLLLGLVTTIAGAVYSIKLGKLMDQGRQKIGTLDIPEVRCKAGVLSSDVPQPWIWKDKDFIFILDTTGQTPDLSPEIANGALVTSRRVFFRRTQGDRKDSREFATTQLPDATLNRDTLQALLGWFHKIGVPLIFIGLWIFNLFTDLLVILLFAVVAVVLFSVRDLDLGFGGAFNLSVVASTPVNLWVVLNLVMEWRYADSLLIMLAFNLAYVLIGALGCTGPSQEAPPPGPIPA